MVAGYPPFYSENKVQMFKVHQDFIRSRSRLQAMHLCGHSIMVMIVYDQCWRLGPCRPSVMYATRCPPSSVRYVCCMLRIAHAPLGVQKRTCFL
jgi:hypothetical protein